MNKQIVAATAALALCASASAAFAGSEMQPGIGNGIALGVPLPEGLYDVTFLNYGSRPTWPAATDVGVAVPVWLVYSTPWDILGGHWAVGATQPLEHVSNSAAGLNRGIIANTLLETSLKWNLGNGFNFGIHEALWLPGAAPYAYNFASFMQVAALTYLKDGWALTATGLFGTGQNGNVPGHYAPNWSNLELTAIRVFGKWELGAIGFGSADLSTPFMGYRKQSQIALGGLIGYDFGQLTTQFKLTRDVNESNYGAFETRAWVNVTVALWNPAPPTPAVAAKY